MCETVIVQWWWWFQRECFDDDGPKSNTKNTIIETRGKNNCSSHLHCTVHPVPYRVTGRECRNSFVYIWLEWTRERGMVEATIIRRINRNHIYVHVRRRRRENTPSFKLTRSLSAQNVSNWGCVNNKIQHCQTTESTQTATVSCTRFFFLLLPLLMLPACDVCVSFSQCYEIHIIEM